MRGWFKCCILAGWLGKEEILEMQKHTRVQTTTDESPFAQWQMHRLDSFPAINLKGPSHNVAEDLPATETCKCFIGIVWHPERRRMRIGGVWLSFRSPSSIISKPNHLEKSLKAWWKLEWLSLSLRPSLMSQCHLPFHVHVHAWFS